MTTDYDDAEVAIWATVHVPEEALIRVRRAGDGYAVAFGNQRFSLELDKELIPLLVKALTKLPDGEDTLTWGDLPDMEEAPFGVMRREYERPNGPEG